MMIHTDRQLAKTREQVNMLLAAIAGGEAPADIDPIIVEASRRAIVEQVQDLNEEIHEYELLKRGVTPVPNLREIHDLHSNLIRARIALGLTQRDLAQRLGLAEQQVQRYESNEYAGASLSRLREVAAALGQGGGEPPAVTEVSALRAKLKASKLPSRVIDRLAPSQLGSPASFADIVARVARALGVSESDLLSPEPLDLGGSASAYKLPATANVESVLAYSAYACHVAEAVAGGAITGNDALPASPDALREACVLKYGQVTLHALIELAWDCGIVVVPLNDPGEFHAGFWIVGEHPVIVLKQRIRSDDRWAFDLAHEICHVADHLSGIDTRSNGHVDADTLAAWADDPSEGRANRYAGRVMLGRDSEEMASVCAELSNGRVDRMKRNVVLVAEQYNVSPAALANYVAFRLAAEGVNWWGAAANLQSLDSDPWATARDVMLGRLDLSGLDDVARALLIQAMAE